MPSSVVRAAHEVPPVWSIDASAGKLYLGGDWFLSDLDPGSLAGTVLTGGLLDAGVRGFQLPVVEGARGFVRDGDWLYFASWGNRIQRLFLGPDGKEAITPVVVDPLVACCAIERFAAAPALIAWMIQAGDARTVYVRSIAGGPIRRLATVTGESQLLAAGGELYLTSIDPVLGPTVRRLDPETGALVTLQAHVGLPSGRFDVPWTASTTRLYWLDGLTLRAVGHAAVDPELVATGLASVRRISTDGTSLFAVQDPGGGPELVTTVLRVNVLSGAVDPVLAGTDVRSAEAIGGKLWWVSDHALNVAEPDGTASQVIFADPTLLLGRPLGTASWVAVPTNEQVGPSSYPLLLVDPAHGTTTILPGVARSLLAAGGASLFAADPTNAQPIVRIPVDAPVRTPETLLGTSDATLLSQVEALAVDGGWLYLSEVPGRGQFGWYRISRVRTDGSAFEELFPFEHRGLALRDGRLWFLCEAACQLPAWTLVSMPLQGGTPRVEAQVGLWPVQLLSRNGLVYVVDTDDPQGHDWGVWAYDPANRRAAKLVGGLLPSGLEVDVSGRWLYVRAGGGLVRRRVLAWDAVGPEQRIENPGGVAAFRTDGDHVYYWRGGVGLKRAAE